MHEVSKHFLSDVTKVQSTEEIETGCNCGSPYARIERAPNTMDAEMLSLTEERMLYEGARTRSQQIQWEMEKEQIQTSAPMDAAMKESIGKHKCDQLEAPRRSEATMESESVRQITAPAPSRGVLQNTMAQPCPQCGYVTETRNEEMLQRAQMLQKLLTLDCMAVDLAAYLNAYPEDAEAIETYHRVSMAADAVRKSYFKLSDCGT